MADFITIKVNKKEYGLLNAELTTLRAQLATAREDALREAAGHLAIKERAVTIAQSGERVYIECSSWKEASDVYEWLELLAAIPSEPAKVEVCVWVRSVPSSKIWAAGCGYHTIYDSEYLPDGSCECGKTISVREG